MAWDMRVAVAVAIAMAGALVLPGCLTFEGRFKSGLSDAHVQVSPAWVQPGLYTALPVNGTIDGFEVQTYFRLPPLPDNYAPDYPTRLPFDDPEFAQLYGESQLAVVHWSTGGPAPNQTMEFWMGPLPVIQAMAGYDVAEGARRAAFRTFVTTVLDVPEGRLEEAADIFVVPTGGTGGGGIASPFEAQTAGAEYLEASLHGASFRVSEAFRSLGGLSAFTPYRQTPPGDPIPAVRGWTMRQVLFLCDACEAAGLSFFGRVDLVEENWTFALRTPVRVAGQGPFSDRQFLLVTPDDSVEAIHWSSSRMSDRQAARTLRDTLERLDREPPTMKDWEFLHGTVETTEDDPSVSWDDWDECPPQDPPAPGC